ncbi:MAG: DUF3047 domain-containing protein [Candidatus Omnitrophota bacterium]
MKYRHRKRLIARWAIIIIFGVISFLLIFFRQEIAQRLQGGRPVLKCEIVKLFSFSDENALKEWEEKVFRDKVLYKVEKEGSLSYVRAVSNNAASAVYYRINLDAKNRRPVVSWKWRVEKFPAKKNPESLEKENEDDFAARVYVIFPAMFITNSKVLEYVWAETLPAGSTGVSPYSNNIKLIVLERGVAKDKEWLVENRDIYADYVKLFGRPPEYNIGAVAFMTNTEHTGTSAVSLYDEVEVGYKE